jgi:hypothetical protein
VWLGRATFAAGVALVPVGLATSSFEEKTIALVGGGALAFVGAFSMLSESSFESLYAMYKRARFDARLSRGESAAVVLRAWQRRARTLSQVRRVTGGLAIGASTFALGYGVVALATTLGQDPSEARDRRVTHGARLVALGALGTLLGAAALIVKSPLERTLEAFKASERPSVMLGAAPIVGGGFAMGLSGSW